MIWSPAQRGDRIVAALWAMGSLATIVSCRFAEPIAACLPACPLRSWTGIPCLTCGGTRAILALARGDIWHAIAFNPLVTCSTMSFIAGGLIAPVWIALGRGVPSLTSLSIRVRGTLLALIIGSWIVVLSCHLTE